MKDFRPLFWIAEWLADRKWIPPMLGFAAIVLIIWAAGSAILWAVGGFIWWQADWLYSNLIGRLFWLFWTVVLAFVMIEASRRQ